MEKTFRYLIFPCLTAVLVVYLTSARCQQEDVRKILWTASWSPDQKYIAVGGADRKIRIFSGRSFELLKVLENNTEVQRISWHPRRNLLAVAAIGDGSKLIDVETDSVIYFEHAKPNGTRAMAWNSRGDMLANADYEGEVTIWNLQGQLLRIIKKETR